MVGEATGVSHDRRAGAPIGLRDARCEDMKRGENTTCRGVLKLGGKLYRLHSDGHRHVPVFDSESTVDSSRCFYAVRGPIPKMVPISGFVFPCVTQPKISVSTSIRPILKISQYLHEKPEPILNLSKRLGSEQGDGVVQSK
jgi:hypothetical protein